MTFRLRRLEDEVTLPRLEWGNAHGVDLGIITKRTLADVQQVATSSDWPVDNYFEYSFNSIHDEHRDPLIQFVKDYAGQPIFLWDEDSEPIVDNSTYFNNTVLDAYTDNLVAAYPMEETAGIVYDKAGQNFQYPSSDAPTYNQVGINNSCLHFDSAISEYLYALDRDALDLTTGLTMSVWIKADSFTAADSNWFFAKWTASGSNRSYGMDLRDGKIRFHISTTGSDAKTAEETSTQVTLDTWYHIVGTFDGTNVKLYVNGSLIDTTAYTGTINTGTASLVIADANEGGSGQEFDGYIDEAYIWDTALTIDDVALLYNSGVGRFFDPSRKDITGGWKYGLITDPNINITTIRDQCAYSVTFRFLLLEENAIPPPTPIDIAYPNWVQGYYTPGIQTGDLTGVAPQMYRVDTEAWSIRNRGSVGRYQCGAAPLDGGFYIWGGNIGNGPSYPNPNGTYGEVGCEKFDEDGAGGYWTIASSIPFGTYDEYTASPTPNRKSGRWNMEGETLNDIIYSICQSSETRLFAHVGLHVWDVLFECMKFKEYSWSLITSKTWDGDHNDDFGPRDSDSNGSYWNIVRSYGDCVYAIGGRVYRELAPTGFGGWYVNQEYNPESDSWRYLNQSRNPWWDCASWVEPDVGIHLNKSDYGFVIGYINEHEVFVPDNGGEFYSYLALEYPAVDADQSVNYNIGGCRGVWFEDAGYLTNNTVSDAHTYEYKLGVWRVLADNLGTGTIMPQISSPLVAI